MQLEGLGSAVNSPSGVWSRAPAEIKFGAFLGRLPKVDLIILGGGMSVGTSVRPQKVSSISMKFGI